MKIVIILIILALSLYAWHLRGELTYRLAEIRNLQNIIRQHGINLKYDDEFGIFYVDSHTDDNPTKRS